LILNRGRELVVEIEFFNDQIEIVDESILDELFNRMIQLVWDLFLLIAILKSQEPQIQFLHSSIDKRLERLITGEHRRDSTCEH